MIVEILPGGRCFLLLRSLFFSFSSLQIESRTVSKSFVLVCMIVTIATDIRLRNTIDAIIINATSNGIDAAGVTFSVDKTKFKSISTIFLFTNVQTFMNSFDVISFQWQVITKFSLFLQMSQKGLFECELTSIFRQDSLLSFRNRDKDDQRSNRAGTCDIIFLIMRFSFNIESG